jgi:hypothetical protein
MVDTKVTYQNNKVAVSAENFKVTAAHLEAAVKHYREAATYYETGDEDSAALNSFTAKRHIQLACQAQGEELNGAPLK